ncbi:hypothetical protein ADUPG1_010553, partial [Aduncisulcus paluster]
LQILNCIAKNTHFPIHISQYEKNPSDFVQSLRNHFEISLNVPHIRHFLFQNPIFGTTLSDIHDILRFSSLFEKIVNDLRSIKGIRLVPWPSNDDCKAFFKLFRPHLFYILQYEKFGRHFLSVSVPKSSVNPIMECKRRVCWDTPTTEKESDGISCQFPPLDVPMPLSRPLFAVDYSPFHNPAQNRPVDQSFLPRGPFSAATSEDPYTSSFSTFRPSKEYEATQTYKSRRIPTPIPPEASRVLSQAISRPSPAEYMASNPFQSSIPSINHSYVLESVSEQPNLEEEGEEEEEEEEEGEKEMRDVLCSPTTMSNDNLSPNSYVLHDAPCCHAMEKDQEDSFSESESSSSFIFTSATSLFSASSPSLPEISTTTPSVPLPSTSSFPLRDRLISNHPPYHLSTHHSSSIYGGKRAILGPSTKWSIADSHYTGGNSGCDTSTHSMPHYDNKPKTTNSIDLFAPTPTYEPSSTCSTPNSSPPFCCSHAPPHPSSMRPPCFSPPMSLVRPKGIPVVQINSHASIELSSHASMREKESFASVEEHEREEEVEKEEEEEKMEIRDDGTTCTQQEEDCLLSSPSCMYCVFDDDGSDAEGESLSLCCADVFDHLQPYKEYKNFDENGHLSKIYSVNREQKESESVEARDKDHFCEDSSQLLPGNEIEDGEKKIDIYRHKDTSCSSNHNGTSTITYGSSSSILFPSISSVVPHGPPHAPSSSLLPKFVSYASNTSCSHSYES